MTGFTAEATAAPRARDRILRDQPAVYRRKRDAIVRHEAREMEFSFARGFKQIPCEF